MFCTPLKSSHAKKDFGIWNAIAWERSEGDGHSRVATIKIQSKLFVQPPQLKLGEDKF
jgi:hypothetical protein